jgi:hypothetical protein
VGRSPSENEGTPPPQLDTRTAHSARVWNYLLDGKDNFAADREVGDMIMQMFPDIAHIARLQRRFLARAVRYLAEEAGIRQFLDVGASLAMSGNTHEVAQSLAPDCRVVYVDNDPMVLAHARAQLASAPGGAVVALDANLKDPAAILAAAAETLDLGRPVAILLMATLSFVLDDAAAARILRSLAGAVPVGSHVSLYHQASDLDPAMSVAAARWNAMSDRQIKLRSRAQLTGLLSGLDLVPPGIMPVTDWRPAPDDPRFERLVPVYGAVARKA